MSSIHTCTQHILYKGTCCKLRTAPVSVKSKSFSCSWLEKHRQEQSAQSTNGLDDHPAILWKVIISVELLHPKEHIFVIQIEDKWGQLFGITKHQKTLNFKKQLQHANWQYFTSLNGYELSELRSFFRGLDSLHHIVG